MLWLLSQETAPFMKSNVALGLWIETSISACFGAFFPPPRRPVLISKLGKAGARKGK